MKSKWDKVKEWFGRHSAKEWVIICFVILAFTAVVCSYLRAP